MRAQQQELSEMVKRIDEKKWKRNGAQRKGARDWENVRGEAILGQVHMALLVRRSLCLAGPQFSAFLNTNVLKNVYWIL